MQRVRDAVDRVPEFDKLSHADKLRFFAWVLHGDGKERIKPADFAACYDAVDLPRPGDIYSNLRALENQGDLLPSSNGHRLAKPAREKLEAKYGQRRVTVQVLKELEDLPAKLQIVSQREYLDEALKCFHAEAWRAAIIMAWNLAYDHLCHYVMTMKLADFNVECGQWKKPVTITQRSDLQDLKESEVISVCRKASITDGPKDRCLTRNLQIRNDAAHPSGAKFSQSQAESFIMDVVQNIVLAVH